MILRLGAISSVIEKIAGQFKQYSVLLYSSHKKKQKLSPSAPFKIAAAGPTEGSVSSVISFLYIHHTQYKAVKLDQKVLSVKKLYF